MDKKFSKIFENQKKNLTESFKNDNESWKEIISFIKIYKKEFDKFLDTDI
jgi:hypothetical protein